MRRFLLGLVLIAVLFGSPYAALLLNQVMGPWSATLTEANGSVSQLNFDPSMPPPDFVPVFPGALVVQSSRLVSQDAPSGIGFLELTARGPAEEVRAFYHRRLARAGTYACHRLASNVTRVTGLAGKYPVLTGAPERIATPRFGPPRRCWVPS